MKRLMMSLIIVMGSAHSAFGMSFPDASRTGDEATPLWAGDAEGYNFEGIISMSGCSGSLIRFDDSQDTDHAIVLTNGHCVKMIDPGVVIVNQATSRTFNLLASDASKLGTLHGQTLLYATMTKTDIGLYQLQETYQDITTKYSIEALVLGRGQPEVGTNIEVISGYWQRGYSCSIEFITAGLKEGGWTQQNSMRYSRPGCDVIGGTSGSPVIAAGSRTVIAINNTISESGQKCSTNNPCEIDKNGNVTIYKKGYGYCQQTYWIYTCRNAQGKFDLTTAGCQLPRPH